MTRREPSSREITRRATGAALLVWAVAAILVMGTTGYPAASWTSVAASFLPAAGTFLLYWTVKSSPASLRRAATGRSLTGPALLGALALLGLLITGVLTFGAHGDVSVSNECRGTTLGAYLDPQPEIQPPPGAVSDVNVGKFCNEDAVHKMHLVFGVLPASLLPAIASGVGFARRRPSRVPPEN